MTWIFLAPASLRTTSNSVCLLDRRRGRAAAAGRRRPAAADDGDVELRLESLDQLGELEDRHVADRVENLVLAQRCVSHCRLYLSVIG